MRKRRIVSIVVALVLCLAMVGTAYASFTDIDNNKHKDAVEQMAKLGILDGYIDGSFQPEGLLNRAAAAKVAGYLLGYTEEDAKAAAKEESIFDDVYKGMGDNEWAMGWINLVAKDDIISGYTNGQYGPGDDLQMVQWVAILVRILGYEEDGMSWPDDYNSKAESLELSAKLAYSGSSILNRGQMARMTNTAIYDVEMPDSRKLIDILKFNGEDGLVEDQEEKLDEDKNGDKDQKDGEQEELVYENVKLSISASKELLAVGGGETTEITLYVSHNNLPAAGVQVGLFANLVSNLGNGDDDRRKQLSVTETVTNSEGKAIVTYTTLGVDDNKHISIMANTRDDDDPNGWTEKKIYVIGSNTASRCQGRIINPFTGEAIPNVKIDFRNMSTGNYFWFEDISDEDGNYSIFVPSGKYYIGFYLDMLEGDFYSGNYGGSHHDFKDDNTIVLRLNEKQIDKNKNNNFATEMGVIKGVVSNLGSHRDLYIHNGTREGTFIAVVKADGSFMIALPEDNYEVNAEGGHILKSNVNVKKGEIIDLGTLMR